ncbi:MAG: winged helix-turn-helix domain-containing protein, partial [Saprospiraceae bacterium]|nr:winged helix-turn-helix domain-containing protein [Saprospiraceae bacterium]
VVRFDTEFEFVGEDIVLWVREAIQESGLKMGYIVEVVSCEDEEVVYSYQHGDVKDPDIIPCKSRPLPLDCYKLYFTPLDEQNLMASSEEVHPPKDGSGELLDRLSLLPVILAALVIGILLFFGVRRFRTKEDENIISLGNYKFDTLNTVLLLDKERTELTSKEADLLLLLYKAVNSTIERGDILQKVWGGGDEYIGRTLDVFISKLRKKLSADPGVKIVNVRGVGYKLIVDQ